MNKTTEALKLAEEALVDNIVGRSGRTPKTHEAIAAIREALAEPVQQKPVAHYKDAPHTIYLQTGCDDPEDCECSFNDCGDTTWCVDQIHDTDIPYIRADYAAPVSAEAIRAEAFKEAAEWCKAKQSYSAMHANTEFAAGIRGLK